MLSAFKPFSVGGDFVNEVDCAAATVLATAVPRILPAIAGIGLVSATVSPRRGMTIVKQGLATGLTQGSVVDINFRFSMTYSGVGVVGFKDQVLCSPYSQGGDSGSLVVDASSLAAVGLHFAGSAKGSIFTPIEKVLSGLGAVLSR
jgi:hypothetical protein